MAKTRAEQIAHHKQRNPLDIMPLPNTTEVTSSSYMLVSNNLSGPRKIPVDTVSEPVRAEIAEVSAEVDTLKETKADKCFAMAMSIVL